MIVYLAWCEFNTSQDGEVAGTLGIFRTKRSAWRCCADDWRMMKERYRYRYGDDRHDRDSEDWEIDYHVEQHEVLP